jgi:REP element-mobilizing transposase RayT
VYGFVVMPEHVHLLISEPKRGTIANAIQSLKISSAKRWRQISVAHNLGTPLWQKRYYDRIIRDHEEFSRCSGSSLHHPRQRSILVPSLRNQLCLD